MYYFLNNIIYGPIAYCTIVFCIIKMSAILYAIYDIIMYTNFVLASGRQRPKAYCTTDSRLIDSKKLKIYLINF